MFLVKSQVPSPTTRVSEEYEAAPGADSAAVGAMVATTTRGYRQHGVLGLGRGPPVAVAENVNTAKNAEAGEKSCSLSMNSRPVSEHRSNCSGIKVGLRSWPAQTRL